MDPVSPLGIVSLASSAFGAGSSLFGGLQSASAQSAAAQYQSQVARNNQIIADQNARYSAQAGRVEGQNQDFRNRTIQGQILAAQSASGIDTNSATSTAVRDSQARLGRLDTQNIMQRAALSAYGSETQATGFGAQSTLDTLQARSASAAGTTGAFSSILGGASSFADKWLRFQTTGVPGFGSLQAS